jgi:diaminopimelate epimerase
MRFHRYHALGNDYLVLDPREGELPAAEAIRLICHRNFGIGSDGILYGPGSGSDGFGLRILNPDGSEAEKSGNGLRIFARYLCDRGEVSEGSPFAVDTPGGRVSCEVREGGRQVQVEMGRVTFQSAEIPVAGPEREVIDEEMDIGGETVRYSAASIGNPHCVVTKGPATAERARRLGPLLETEARFPNRTNVQFLEVVDRRHIRIEIWERGAGYTLASGSSSSAAAAVAHRLGLIDDDVTVQMPGGNLRIEIGADYAIRMTGPVTRIATIDLADEALRETLPDGA